MAMAMPPRDMMLAVTPSIRKGMKDKRITTGRVITGMRALGMCHRKMNTTRATMMSTSMTVDFRLSMERRMRSDRS
jgi:hypothetical protein